jgi:mannose-1-phosphate guanylyltransferase
MRIGVTAPTPLAPRLPWAAAHDPKTVVAVLAADHVFEDGKRFAQLCAQAYAAAAAGEIVTFGVTPDHPAIGYGYIDPGAPLALIRTFGASRIGGESPTNARTRFH